jgi:hypothetical protein
VFNIYPQALSRSVSIFPLCLISFWSDPIMRRISVISMNPSHVMLVGFQAMKSYQISSRGWLFPWWEHEEICESSCVYGILV